MKISISGTLSGERTLLLSNESHIEYWFIVLGALFVSHIEQTKLELENLT